jgi:catechol-2,3-dioxygenase
MRAHKLERRLPHPIFGASLFSVQQQRLSKAEVIMSPSPKPIGPNPHPVDPGVNIGHVHLKVADLNRAIAFYCGVLGFNVMQRYGHEAAFLSAGEATRRLGGR